MASKKRTRIISVPAAAQGTSPASGSAGQDSKKQVGDPRCDGRTVLSGPSVGQSQGDPRRGDRKGSDRANRAMELPPRAWIQAVKTLELSEEQTTQLDAIVAEHQEAMKTYAHEHGKALQDLRKRMREAVQKGEKPESAREELKALQQAAPKFDTVQKRVWEILTAEQQEQLKVKLEQLRAQMAQRQGERGAGRGRDSAPGRGEMGDRSKGGDRPSSPQREQYERQRGGRPGSAASPPGRGQESQPTQPSGTKPR